MTTWSRVSMWHDDRGDVRQVEVALLSPVTLEELRRVVEQAGPFDTPDEVLRRAHARMEEWVRLFGIQQELELS